MEWFVIVGIGFVVGGSAYLFLCWRERQQLRGRGGSGRGSVSELQQLFDDYERERRRGGQ